ncbi:peptide-methionine (R)-S-oxide reductase MsrB [Flavihumibacter sp. R14]|nr:peptide-methionine (R)-S-oxide reductase MsrB [Flavihumibacter soli]
MKAILVTIFATFVLIAVGCQSFSENKTGQSAYPVQKTDDEWKKLLSPESHAVMVKGGTEAPFNNPYNKNYQKGIYVSAATGAALFSSEDKFDSGTGWPSFTKPVNDSAVKIIDDNAFGLSGYEVVEAKTGLHLGHVFNDGPREKGGKRYCINSAALKFIKGR